MNYEDALAACLDAVLAGKDLEQVVAAFPEHAARLREDLQLATALQAYSTLYDQRLEAARPGAHQSLSRELNVLRAQRPASVATVPWSWRLPGFGSLAFAAALAIAAVTVVAFGAGLFGATSTAEALTIEGVVVERTDDSVVLQTESGLHSLGLDATAAITSEDGTTAPRDSIEAGQVVLVRAKRLPQGALRVVSLQKRPQGALADWCRTHPGRCQEVEPRLPHRAIACQPSCAPLATATGDQADKARLAELAERCQRAGGDTCEELRRFCRANPVLCAVLTGWLRTLIDLPDDAGVRLRILTQRCQNGLILDCRELRLLCERLRQACPMTSPDRPDAKSTPKRPLN